MRTRPPLICGYDALKARGKRPVPMWADRFLRDTLELTAEEIGAYHLILYAMWKRPTCVLQNDDSRLARIARVSVRKWRAQVGPAILGLMDASGDFLTSSKLLEEAEKTEDWCITQHVRNCELCKEKRVQSNFSDTPKRGKKDDENPRNLLKNNNPPLTGDSAGDVTGDVTGGEPSQRTNIKIHDDGNAGARENFGNPDRDLLRVRILAAMGVGPDGVVGPSKFVGTQADTFTAGRWLSDLVLTEDEIVGTVSEVMAKKPNRTPPSTFAYFNRAMELLAEAKSAPALTPAAGGNNEPTSYSSQTRGQFGGGYQRGTSIASVVARDRLNHSG